MCTCYILVSTNNNETVQYIRLKVMIILNSGNQVAFKITSYNYLRTFCIFKIVIKRKKSQYDTMLSLVTDCLNNIKQYISHMSYVQVIQHTIRLILYYIQYMCNSSYFRTVHLIEINIRYTSLEAGRYIARSKRLMESHIVVDVRIRKRTDSIQGWRC